MPQPNHTIFTTDCERFKQKLTSENQSRFYLFGYGSLMWKFEFEYEKKIYGFCEGFRREFWLLSDDHRGTPERMGRVATLVKSPGRRVFGVAYEFRIENIERLFEYLNFREKCGYSLNEVHFEPLDQAQRLNTICYYANEENPYFSPQRDLVLLAKQIHESEGPSGTNKEYLFNLCKSLRTMAAILKDDLKEEVFLNDANLFELEAAVEKLDSLNFRSTN